MLRFMIFGLAAAILAAMLHWGSGSPQRATDISRTILEPGPEAPPPDETASRPRTAAEIAAIIAEIKAGPERTAFDPDSAAQRPELAVTLIDTSAEPPEDEPAPLVLAEPDMPVPAPEVASLDIDPAAEDPADLETEFLSARYEAPEVSFAVSRSRLPVPRPALPRSPGPAVNAAAATKPAPAAAPERIVDLTVKPAAPEPAPAPATIKPTAVRLALAEAMEDVPPEPVMLAVTEALAEDGVADDGVVYVSGTKVNLREEPSIGASVVTSLLKGDAARILADTGDGWLHIRDISSGDEGYMAEIFLTAANPG